MNKQLWHVMANRNKPENHHYYYGPLSEIHQVGLDLSEYNIVPESEWTANDIAEITSNLLEDVNKHSSVNHPQDILSMLRESNVQESNIQRFMKLYMNRMFTQYGTKEENNG